MNAINWKRALYIVLVLAAIISSINWFLGDRSFTFGFVMDCIGKASTVVAAIAVFFCKIAWKSKLFRNWLVLIPNINGVWNGKLQSDWVDPTTNEKFPPIDVVLTIKQSLFKTSCMLNTNESSSHSITSAFLIDPESQVCRLIYAYQNDPKQTLQNQSRIHYGTAMLDVKDNNNVISLEGNYFTGRGSSGYMSFTAHPC